MHDIERQVWWGGAMTRREVITEAILAVAGSRVWDSTTLRRDDLGDFHSLLPEVGSKIDGGIDFEIGCVAPEIHHLTDVVVALRFKDQDVASLRAQASKDTDGLESCRLRSSVPPLTRFFDYLGTFHRKARPDFKKSDVQHFFDLLFVKARSSSRAASITIASCEHTALWLLEQRVCGAHNLVAPLQRRGTGSFDSAPTSRQYPSSN
jgi:hypothetical protein